MKTEHIEFFNQAPIAREIYYLEALKDYRRASEFYAFLREARLRGMVGQLQLLIDNQVASVDMDLRKGTPPSESLFEFIANWVIGLAYRDIAIVEEMRQIWPQLPAPDWGPYKKPAPQIDPEGL